jgi:hypothetical protein
MMSELCLFSI